MSSLFRQQLEAWIRTLDIKAHSVLDIGGSQKPIKGRTRSWTVENYYILDLPEPHVDAEDPHIRHDIQQPMPDAITAGVPLCDAAFCLEVAEYWYDPMTAIENIADLLAPDGLLYISFPFVYPQHRPAGLDLLRYTPDGAERLLHECGFEIVTHVLRKASSPLLRQFYATEGMKAAEGKNHDATGSLIIARKRSG